MSSLHLYSGQWTVPTIPIFRQHLLSFPFTVTWLCQQVTWHIGNWLHPATNDINPSITDHTAMTTSAKMCTESLTHVGHLVLINQDTHSKLAKPTRGSYWLSNWCGMPTCQWYSHGWFESFPWNIQHLAIDSISTLPKPLRTFAIERTPIVSHTAVHKGFIKEHFP
jgi:hypothetical protein